MKKHLSKRLLSLVLALVLCVGLAAPAAAADHTQDIQFEQVDNSLVSASLEDRKVPLTAQEMEHATTDRVRVSIVLEEESTLAAGYSAENVAENASAMSYRQTLRTRQDQVAQAISAQALNGQQLDVVWNLTLAANIISANVQYGQIEAIAKVAGVADVFVETQYAPDVVETGAADPNMATSSAMIGSGNAWASGYTGVGSKIAVIDTGTDTDHQSFDADAFLYAIEQTGKEVDLMDDIDIADVKGQLNVGGRIDPQTAYLNAKLPFAYNYVDKDYDITHDKDDQGEHGSHVAGIATANRYIPNGDGTYSEALTSVHTQGVAPDAQLITMKVFGKGGGAYDSDYMAAIEDAIVLGADSINLSLGSGNPGFSNHNNKEYQDIMENLTKAGAVVCISAGNSGTWQENTIYGFLYNDGVSMQTDGSPGSYTNSFTVASVDNTGNTGSFLDFGEGLSAVSFTETSGYTNAPIATLDTTGNGTEYDFVLFENTGKDGSGNNLLTDYAELCAGKVVMVYRGTSSFYEKHDAVGEVGGAACIVVNNQPGTINMDLSSSTATIPCVSITQADGEAIKELATTTAVTDEADNVLYYTGKVTISSAVQAVQGDVDGYKTMSSFSSWGVPGSLELKPEITAPGGNIYSVNGIVAGGKAYENMSGTSMASPQMAGMSAVMAQYIRENDLTAKTGLSARQLAQSLLMSTAEPLIEDREDAGCYYYSVLNQGAGLANVSDAINANSYIMMADGANAGAADGKVKVELGDDAAKTGKYSFSYTLNNLKNEPSTYTFDTDVFTQDVFSSGTYTGVDTFLDTWTAELTDAKVSYQVNGVALDKDTEEVTYTEDDVQKVLDYVSGKGELTAIEKTAYDLDGDKEITSYDAYLMLNLVKGAVGVSVPANGSIEVTVTIDVAGCDFDDYPTGAYIEAYSYATEASTPEGEEGTVHSIPVLGYYGSWTDPSMYDVGTLAEIWYETEIRYPYLINETYAFTNYLTVKYPGDTGEYYYFGNPLTDDDEYLPERNAFNSDGSINKYYATIIRNAGNAKIEVTDANTKDVYYSQELGSVYGAYYYSNGAAWRNTQSSFSVGWQGTDAQGDKLPEGTEVNISLILAPEYYANEDGSYNWVALGDGAYMTTRTAIDNTAPEMENLSLALDGKTLVVEASDNRYLATVALYKRGVEREVDFIAPNQALKDIGAVDTYEFDISDIENGTDMYIQLTDYAMNQSTYKFVLKGNNEPQNPTSITLPETATVVKGTSIILTPSYEPWIVNEGVVWSSANEDIATVDENGKVTGVDAGTTTITATSVYNEEVFGTCEVTVKFYDVTLNGMLQDKDGNPQLFTWNLATDKTWTKTADLENNINAATFDFAHEDGSAFQMDTSGYLYKVDPATGKTLEKSANTAEVGAPVDDMEYAGRSSLNFEQDVLVGVYGSYLLYSIPGMDNTFSYGWNMANYLSTYLDASNFTAVAWAGYTTNDAGNNVDVFFCLTDSGDFWVMMPDFTTGSASMNFYETDLELDFPGYDSAYYCSMVMGDDGNFYLSYFNGATNQIYVLEGEDIYQDGEYYDTVYHATLLGDVGDGVWPTALLTVSPNETEGEDEVDPAALNIESKLTAQAEAISLPDPEPTGSLNATVSAEPQNVGGSTIEGRETLKVTINESEAAPNGKYVVSYDPNAVELLNATSDAPYYSIHDDENGSVTVAFAAKDNWTPNDVATLTFAYKHAYVETTVTIDTEELGSKKGQIEDGSTSDEVIGEPEGHKGVLVGVVTPTKDHPKGYSGDVVCQLCGEILKKGHNLYYNEGGSSTPTVQSPFIDVKPTDDAFEAINYLYENGIMDGVGDGKFDPNATLTRAMVVTILYRLDGKEAVTFAGAFSDVPGGQWYSDAVEWAAKYEIVKGMGDGKFDPNGKITREQLAAILQRYAAYKNLRTSASAALNASAQVSEWAKENVQWAVALNLLPDGKSVNATANANRAEVAVAIYNFIMKLL